LEESDSSKPKEEVRRRSVKIGIAQMRVADDVRLNVRKGIGMVGKAARMGADVVCLPELFAWRYFPARRDSKAASEPIPGPISRALSKAAKKADVVVVGGSIYEASGGRRFNTCVVFDEGGTMISKYRKVHIPQDDHYYEKDYFSPGKRYQVAKTKFGRIGTLICFDQWYPEPARVLKLMGADVLFYPTAIGWVRGIEPAEGNWKRAWEAVQLGHAISNSMVVCAVNRVGVEGATEFWGGSFICDQFGKVLFRAGEEEEGVWVVECDLGLSDEVEEGWGFLRNRAKETYSEIVR
jgi:agmatine deiminase